MFKSPLRWGIVCALVMVSAAGAQITAPLTHDFKKTKFEYWNERGDLLETVTLSTNRLDTLQRIRIRGVVLDTIARPGLADSSSVILLISAFWENNLTFSERDTVRIGDQFHFPVKSGGGATKVKDSLFTVIFNTAPPTIGDNRDVFVIQLRDLELDEGHPQRVIFPNDTCKGLAVDTSEIITLRRGLLETTFGFLTDTATPEITYTLIYNLGYGWGDANPTDTLAGKSWTDDILTTGRWYFRDSGTLLEGELIRVIRHGGAAGDSAVVEEVLRARPR